MNNPYNFYVRKLDPVLTDEGQLHINVFDNNRGRPITDAEIKITPSGESNVLVDTRTDASGRTRKY